MSYTVELEMESEPTFPDRCVVCGAQDPGSHVLMVARFNGMKPLDEDLARPHRAQVPTCPGCQSALRRSRWLGKLTMAIATLCAAGAVVALTMVPPQYFDGWMGYGALALAIGLPLGIGIRSYSSYFDFSPWGRRMMYEFRGRDYAQAFAEANDGRIR